MRKIILCLIFVLLCNTNAFAANVINGVSGYASINAVTTPTSVNAVTQTWAPTTATFSIAADNDDASSYADFAAWPPTYTASTNTSSNAKKQESGSSTTRVDNGFLNFDTSSIPDGATITAATLEINLAGVYEDESPSRNYNCEYYTWTYAGLGAGTFTTGDGAANAFSVTVASLTPSAVNTFVLSNPNTISKTGYTGFRLLVSGGNPASNKVSYVPTTDYPTVPVHVLKVTY